MATTAAVTGDIDFSALIGSLIGAAIKGAPLKLVAQVKPGIKLVSKNRVIKSQP